MFWAHIKKTQPKKNAKEPLTQRKHRLSVI